VFVVRAAWGGAKTVREELERKGTETKEREMRKLFSTRRRIAIVAAVAVVALTGVAAFAYFTSTGSGIGAAKVGTNTAWTTTGAAYVGGPMTPGGGDATREYVKYKVNNPSSGQQAFTNVNIKIADSTGATWTVAGSPACTKSDFELSLDGTTWAAPGAAIDDVALASNVGPGLSTIQSTVWIHMIDTTFNQDACKTADVPLYFYVS
jgi:hypothetical protein